MFLRDYILQQRLARLDKWFASPWACLPPCRTHSENMELIYCCSSEGKGREAATMTEGGTRLAGFLVSTACNLFHLE